MDIQFEKVLRPLDLGDYLGEGENAYRGKLLSVWVNPDGKTRAERQFLLMEYARILAAPKKKKWNFRKQAEPVFDAKKLDELLARNYKWLESILNQDVENPCTVHEIKSLREVDTVLYEWILKRSVDMIAEYQEEKKRPSKAPLKT